MPEQQPDLFSHTSVEVRRDLSHSTCHALLAPEIDDESLVAAIPGSTLGDSRKLVAKAGRRRMATAVPALAALCRSFTSFGTDRTIPEQAAVIEALTTIGGG